MRSAGFSVELVDVGAQGFVASTLSWLTGG